MPRRLKIFFDGGYRGDPASMEIAVVAAGQATILRDLGPGSSADAEWLALIQALTVARSTGASDFVLIGDSADVIAKANGLIRCRSDAARHLDRFRAMAGEGGPPRVRQVKRSQNLAGIALERLRAR